MIKLAEFARRRKQLMRMADEDAILVLPSAPMRVRSHDTHYPYRQDSDFWYLSGFAEPEAVLVLVPGRKHGEALLFCRERDADREAWDGPRAGPEGAVDIHGFDDAYPIADLDEILPGLLEGRSRVYYHFGRDTEFDLKLIGWVNRVRAQVRHGAQPPHEFLELGHLLDEMRLFKSRDELKLMKRAARISVQAHEAAMRAARPGVHEYELQAELERVFRDTEFDLKLIGWLNRVRAQVRLGAQPPHEFLELGHLLDEMRLFKSRDELKLMKRAAKISVQAHEAAMRAARPGLHEYELQAELERVFRAADAEPAYSSIVGAGANACILHYRDNAAQARDGELVLIDAGAEYRGYAADITRTFPANGRFSAEQRALHDLVGAAQAAALAQARTGIAYEAGHNAAVETLTEGLLKLGLLKGKLEKNIAEGMYKRYYPHKTGHWLGLDVHDVGDYRIDGESRLLEPGMAFTIEPGLYVPTSDMTVAEKWRGIGIRIEDNVVVTKDGHEVLTEGLARSADEIEALMAAR